jgi:hypothetical protein
MKILKRRMLLLPLLLLAVSCSSTIKYQGSSVQVKPLKTKARNIILHEDYIFSEQASGEVKQLLINHLVSGLAKYSKYKVQRLKSGAPIPQNNSNKPQILLVANIWFHQGTTNGQEVVKVQRDEFGINYRKSWEELENRSWEQLENQSIISLYFLEIGKETNLLRAAITVTNDKKQKTTKSGHSAEQRKYAVFYQIKGMQPGYDLIAVSSDISQPDQYIPELIKKSVKQLLVNL